MKISLALFLVLLIVILTNTFAAEVSRRPDPVLDIAGRPLRRGVGYYVTPVFWIVGGGLTFVDTKVNGTCRMDVVVEPSEVDRGLPVSFTPVNENEEVVRLSTDLNIKFSGAETCAQSTTWKVSGPESENGQFPLTGNGVEGNAGCSTLTSWFRIERDGDDYKFVFCPSVCPLVKVICKDIGIYDGDEGRRLALTDQPLTVSFVPVEKFRKSSA